MRRSLLASFHQVWIDNLNGDKSKTGKIIPQDLPGGGSADQSIFTLLSSPRYGGLPFVEWSSPNAGLEHFGRLCL